MLFEKNMRVVEKNKFFIIETKSMKNRINY